MTQTGKGEDRILGKKFESKRNKYLFDSTDIDDDTLTWYQISSNHGEGLANPENYERKQNPYPVKGAGIRKKKTIDIRYVTDEQPWLGW